VSMQVQLLWANNPQENTNSSKPIQGPKLYSKVLTIEPNRLLKILMAAKLICEFY
jgi:hypothetical protein